MRQRIQSQTERPGSTPTAVFHNGQKRKTPAPKGARVYRRMGEGLGAGGHSTRRYAFNARASPRFLRLKLFSSLASPGKAPATRARPVCLISRQFEVAAIGKLKISQTDAKASLFPAAALDHVARADREPAGETVCKRTHEIPPGSNATAGNFPAPMSKHRDGSETARRQAQISVDRCGQGARDPNAGQIRNSEVPQGNRVWPTPDASRPRSKIEAIVLRQSLERRLGPGAEMLDHFGRHQRPEPRRVAIVGAAREPDQKTRGE